MVLLVGFCRRTQTFRETDPLTVDLTFLINAAAVLGLRSGTDLINKLFFILGRKLILPREPAHFLNDMVLKLNYTFVILDHNLCKLL